MTPAILIMEGKIWIREPYNWKMITFLKLAKILARHLDITNQIGEVIKYIMQP